MWERNGMPAILIILCAVLALAAGPSAAGDRAQRQILGFSPDGAYFAFEQYGVQDGSGFPYSEIFVIDTAKDQWAAGAPIRKLIKDETETAKVEDARKAAANEAKPLLARLRIGVAGETLFSDPDVASGSAPMGASPASQKLNDQRVALKPSGPGEPRHLLLEERAYDTAECQKMIERPAKVFALHLEYDSGPHLIYEDDTLPASRRCAVSYAVSDVIRFRKPGPPAPDYYVVLIRVEHLPGFEGPDFRYIAVTQLAP
jgi:predicted secreted protein